MEQMINTLGFPIACVIALGGAMSVIIKYFIEKDKSTRIDTNKIIKDMRTDSKEDREMYISTINKFNTQLDKFAVALEVNNIKLGAIEEDVKKIKEKVEV